MNEWHEISIYTPDDTLYNVGSVYGSTGIIPAEWSSSLLAGFPWLSFLQEHGDLPIYKDIQCFGLVSNVNKVNAIRTANDAAEFYMNKESRLVVASNLADYHDWVKLPDSLAWLYGDRPYMIAEHLDPILGELSDAARTGEASDDLYKYVSSHTLAHPYNTQKYIAYNEYHKFAQHPDMRGSDVLYEFGQYISDEKEKVDIVINSDHIQISDPKYKTLELLIQERIGNRLSTQRIVISADYDFVHDIHLTTDDVGGVQSLQLNSKRDINISITRCYDVTNRIPVYFDPDHQSTTRKIEIYVLSTNTGWVSMPSTHLKVNGVNLYSGVATSEKIDASNLTFDGLVFNIGPIKNSKLYVEYTASWE